MNDPVEWGKSVAALVKGFVGKAVDALNSRMDALEQKLAAIPSQIDGPPGPAGEKGEKGDSGANGRDAEPISKAQLIEALNGMPEVLQAAIVEFIKANPPAAGKDGADGRDGKDADPISDEQIARAVASHIALNPPAPGRDGRDGMPGAKGADGVNGKDGRDGLDLRNFSAEVDPSGRTVMLTLSDGERTEHAHLTFPVVIDRGVFREAGPESGGPYERGDGVTFGGSFWIAQKDAPEGKPGEPGANGWRLAVKRGRDGKEGAPGKDFTPRTPVKLS